jgi:hypothetical protein
MASYRAKQGIFGLVGPAVLEPMNTGTYSEFGPSPCPGHYAGRWATMASADF